MTTDKNRPSVLARLMSIDRPSPPPMTHGRQRVLSQSYLQSVACVSSKRVMETNLLNGNSRVAGKTCLSSTALSSRTGHKTKAISSVGRKVVGLQARRKNKLRNNDTQGTLGAYGLAKEIAKQITSQVEHSVWHSCIEVLRSKPTSDRICADQRQETVVPTAHFCDKVNKTEFSSQDSSKRITHKASDVMLVEGTRSIGKSKLKSWQVGSARFLSKPNLYPSAWVPRSKERCFMLDRSWCLKPAEWKLCDMSMEENVSHEAVNSSSQRHSPSLDFEKFYWNDKESSITSNSERHEKQSTLDAILTARESSSDVSAIYDKQSPSYHEACESLEETCNDHLEKYPYQDISHKSLFTASDFPSFSQESEEATGKDSKELSAKSSNIIVFEAVAPAVKDLVSGQQLKKTSPPGSPVSSLEGPEARRHSPNFNFESKDFRDHQGLEIDTLGLQTKLHLIESLSLESSSEGPEMVLSSDGDDECSSVWCYREDAQITECTLEKCEFSYLVDVLVESCILMGDLDVSDGTRCPHGFVMDPSVFDSVEKKFGKSTVSERSKRRLLFDRINLGLVKILQPPVRVHSWRKSVAERLVGRRSQEFIEDELWDLLVKQEEEFKSESSEKVRYMESGWLELEQDVDLIVQELQSLLIDGLVEEFVAGETLSS